RGTRSPRFQRQDYTRYTDDRERGDYRAAYGRQAYDQQGWGEAGYDTGPSPREERVDRDSPFRAGDLLGRAGRRVAEFFQGDHDHGQPRSFSGLGPKGYKRSDARINEDVNDRLTDDPWLDARQIAVVVSNCEVTLSGTVDSRDA